MLAVDLGTITTRAYLFDVAEGQYRFVAQGTSPTTAGAPYHDVGEGFRRALTSLENVTGRTLVGADGNLTIPATPGGTGVDSFAATLSAGSPLKTVIVGLLEDVSVESAQNLAATTYAQVVETISLNDRRMQEERIDVILRTRPDVIIIAGGTEGGASQSVRNLMEAVGLACYLMPQQERPRVLFAGNKDLQPEVESSLESLARLYIAPNIRPTLETEQLGPAQIQMGHIFRQVRAEQIRGLSKVNAWSEEGLIPTGGGFGRVIQFLSRVYDPGKGVLGINLGASAATLAAAFSGQLELRVFPGLGLGDGARGLLQQNRLADISRWIAEDIPDEVVRDYIYNKSIYPASLPVTDEELAVEYAMARQAIRTVVRKSLPGFPAHANRSVSDLLPWFEPIMASGSVITNAPSSAWAMLALLDGIQPTGVSTLVLDHNDMAPVLGAAAKMNTIMAVQILESNAFRNLGTVVSPIGYARPGTPVLRVRVVYESGEENTVEIKYGNIKAIPVPSKQVAQLHLRPLHRFDVGMGGPGRGGRLRVVGGALGVVIDARGRPLSLPEDPAQRRELLTKWRWALES